MKTCLVLYYSNTGSNKYLANKIASDLDVSAEELIPKIRLVPLLMILSAMNQGIGSKRLEIDLTKYDTIILAGPIWMGKLVAPLRGFMQRLKAASTKLIFVTCCGSSDERKLEKFGYGLVFKEVEALLGKLCLKCQAFPIDLVLPEEKKEDDELIMKTRLSDENFNGEIKDRFDRFIAEVKSIY